MIEAIAVGYIRKHVQNNDTGVAYIFCNYKKQADQTAVILAAVIPKQLIRNDLYLQKLWKFSMPQCRLRDTAFS